MNIFQVSILPLPGDFQIFFLPAMLVNTINFYQFVSFTVALNFAGGHKASKNKQTNKQKLVHLLLASQLIRLKFHVMLKQFKFNFQMLLKNKIYVIRGNHSCFTDCNIKQNKQISNLVVHLDVYELIFDPYE